MTSVLFLHIDGVLLLPCRAGSSPGWDCPEACLAALSQILERSGAHLVLSSTRRCDGDATRIFANALQRFGARHGGPLNMITNFATSSRDLHAGRCQDIEAWLQSPEAADVGAWVALVEEESLPPKVPVECPAPHRDFAGHVVRTASHEGLTDEVAKLAVELFRRQRRRGSTEEEVEEVVPASSGPSSTQSWELHRLAAAAALRRKAWAEGVRELRSALDLKAEWSQGYLALHEALLRVGDQEGSVTALRRGTLRAMARLRHSIESCMATAELADQTFSEAQVMADSTMRAMRFTGKMVEVLSADASCTALGYVTKDDQNRAMLLYQDVVSGRPWLSAAPRPLRLVFLDVDGVLNVSGARNTGTLCPVRLARLQSILESTRAVVVLSSSWRSFDELRPLMLGCLPRGRVVGQTPAGFTNHTRPREILDVLQEPSVQQALAMPGASWAAVDDMNLVSQAQDLASSDRAVKAFVPNLRQHFVRTDKHVGLDGIGIERLRRILAGR